MHIIYTGIELILLERVESGESVNKLHKLYSPNALFDLVQFVVCIRILPL